MRPTFVSCVVGVCCLGLEPLWHSCLPLCHSGNADADQTGISWVVRKDGNHWTRGPAELLQEMYWPSSCVCVGPYIWHSWRWILMGAMLCAFKNFIRSDFTVGRCWYKSFHLQSLQRCYCVNSGSPASACVMWRHYSITYLQSLHTINGLIAVGWVGNLLCEPPRTTKSKYSIWKFIVWICGKVLISGNNGN